MSHPLPTGGFHWVDIHSDEIGELVNCSDHGYLLETKAVTSCSTHKIDQQETDG